MAKHLDQPILVVAPQYADRLDITGFTVDAVAKTLLIRIAASGDNGQGGRTMIPYPDRILDETQTQATMAAAGTAVVIAALQALNVGPATVSAIAAQLADDPAAVGAAYYAATRDALYSWLVG